MRSRLLNLRMLIQACTAAALLCGARAEAQVRGVYPLGMSATASGAAPAQGVTYSNMFLLYSRDRLTDANGHVVSTGQNSVLMDMNTVTWGSKKEILGSATYAFAATIPLANNSLSSDVGGAISGGGGLADSFYQPVIVGWRAPRVQVKAAYGFLAPTGRFDATAHDNVGSGYWTHVVSSGQSVLFADDRWTLSTFEMYEVHATQEGTGIRPGDTFDLDYSLLRAVPTSGLRLQLGLAGYSQRQMSAKSGPTVTPQDAASRYAVDALGFAATLAWPERNASLAFKYFDELSTESTFEGYSFQVSASIGF